MGNGSSSLIEKQSSNITQHYGWFVVSIAALFYCYEYFLRISPSVMAHDLRSAFHLSGASFGNLSDFYYYIYTPLQFVVGLLLDRYGTRRLLTIACFSCALGALLFGISDYYWVAAAGRLLIGFGSAFAFVGALKLASVWLPKDRFAYFAAVVTTLGMVGGMVGDLVLTELVKKAGWRGTMIDAAIVGLILAVMVFIFVRGRHYKEKRTMTEKMDMDFPFLLRGLVHALRKPQMWIVGVIGALLYLTLTGFSELWAIPYFKAVHHFNSMQAASLNTAMFLGWAIGGPVIGYISDRLRTRRKIMIACAFMAFVFSTALFCAPITYPYWVVYGLLLLLGMAASGETLAFACGKELNSEKMTATSVALINAFVMLSGLIFQPLIGKALDLGWDHKMVNGVKVFSATDFHHAMLILPAAMFLAFILSLTMRKDHL